MENNKEDDQDDFIESSQVPTLRSRIRQQRPNYTIACSPKKVNRKSAKRLRDNKTVSQCLRQVWKKPQNKPSSVATTKQPTGVNNAAATEEDYIKFPTQQESPKCGIQQMPSVSLFDRQDDALARYIRDEHTEAQVEEQLQKLLDGFQAEYEQKCAELERSPEPHDEVEHASPLKATLLPVASVELAAAQANGRQKTLSPLPMFSEPFVMPNFSEELQRMQDVLDNDNPVQLNLPPLPAPVTPSITFPIAKQGREEEMESKMDNVNAATPIVTGNACLDLSVQKDPSSAENANRSQASKIAPDEPPKTTDKRVANLPIVTPFNAPRMDNVLDLSMKHSPAAAPSRVTNYSTPKIIPHRPPNNSTSDFGIQTNLRPKSRNVGIQHRPVASFEFTNRNMIVLAQQFEADPSMLQRKLKRIAKTSTEPIWQERDLSTVFTNADPYYANLKHFL
uniref:Uncharacterized protein n=1 Tax=Anopheles culicifacies TaxID=139723 RepID=A0A182LVU1_9DIPT